MAVARSPLSDPLMAALSKGHTLAPAPAQRPTPLAAPCALPLDLLMGRLTQVASGSQGGGSTVAAAWVRSAQRLREPVAWVQWQGGSLFPPDLHAQGIALDALLVVHVGEPQQAKQRLRATELLLRSGGFGLVVVDLTEGRLPTGLAWQHRLQHWARQQHSAVLMLTRSPKDSQAPSDSSGGAAGGPTLGALISLQLYPERRALGPGQFMQRCAVGKNKLGSACGPWEWQACGPPGLR